MSLTPHTSYKLSLISLLILTIVWWVMRLQRSQLMTSLQSFVWIPRFSPSLTTFMQSSYFRRIGRSVETNSLLVTLVIIWMISLITSLNIFSDRGEHCFTTFLFSFTAVVYKICWIAVFSPIYLLIVTFIKIFASLLNLSIITYMSWLTIFSCRYPWEKPHQPHLQTYKIDFTNSVSDKRISASFILLECE